MQLSFLAKHGSISNPRSLYWEEGKAKLGYVVTVYFKKNLRVGGLEGRRGREKDGREKSGWNVKERKLKKNDKKQKRKI